MTVLRVGARGSRLSVIQTHIALDRLSVDFPECRFDLATFFTPGDRDLKTPIERADNDFFTRDLDRAVLDGTIDFAVHSAKDMPHEIAEGLDWFWLPYREDRHDAIVSRAEGLSAQRQSCQDGGSCLDEIRRVGVSSDRRRVYAARRFPKAALLPIRGAIDSRIGQLLRGDFDAVIMAKAAINRLYGNDDDILKKLNIEEIPFRELNPPEAQGVLAVVFRHGDGRLVGMRDRYVKAVRFVSAGVGNGMLTLKGRDDLLRADVVLADELIPDDALQGIDRGKIVFVGKRAGRHSMKQEAISRMICDEARKGKRVVRLKGGDAGIFGRLSEETEALSELKIPFVVRAGVSSLTVATTATGLLLTKRGESSGFTVDTPTSRGSVKSNVRFMSVGDLCADAKYAREDVAVVLDAGGAYEKVKRFGHGVAPKLSEAEAHMPGIVIENPIAQDTWPKFGSLGGKRVLVTSSVQIQKDIAEEIEDRGGRPVFWPMIGIKGVLDEIPAGLRDCDFAVFTSPNAVREFFKLADGRFDIRTMPRIITCGRKTGMEFEKRHLPVEIEPDGEASADALVVKLNELAKADSGLFSGKRIMRFKSDLADSRIADALARLGADVEEIVLYRTVPVKRGGPLPEFDAVHFASASAVRSFVDSYGSGILREVEIMTIGEPTRRVVKAL